MIDSTAIERMKNKDIQTFMLEFYSRNSEHFITKNSAKQRLSFFCSEGAKLASKRPRSQSPIPDPSKKKTNSAKVQKSRPKRQPSPVSKSRRSAEVEESRVMATIGSVQRQVEALTTANEKKSVSLEAIIARVQSKFESALDDVSKKVGGIEKRLTQLEKKVRQQNLDQAFATIEKLESVQGATVQTLDELTKTVKSLREDTVRKLETENLQQSQGILFYFCLST